MVALNRTISGHTPGGVTRPECCTNLTDTIPATGVLWTNVTGMRLRISIRIASGTPTGTVAHNGTTILNAYPVPGLVLDPGDTLTLTYTGGTLLWVLQPMM